MDANFVDVMLVKNLLVTYALIVAQIMIKLLKQNVNIKEYVTIVS